MRRRRDSRDVRRPGLSKSLGGPCKGLASPHEFFFLLLKEEYQGRAREILHAKAPHSRRVKSSLALYNLSKWIERPLLFSPTIGISSTRNSFWNRESKTVLDYPTYMGRYDGKSIPHSRLL